MAWIRGKKVNALWTNDSRSNPWAYIDGAWRKFDDDHDDTATNFMVMAAAAKGDNSNVDIRWEDNRVKEMYVW